MGRLPDPPNVDAEAQRYAASWGLDPSSPDLFWGTANAYSYGFQLAYREEGRELYERTAGDVAESVEREAFLAGYRKGERARALALAAMQWEVWQEHGIHPSLVGPKSPLIRAPAASSAPAPIVIVAPASERKAMGDVLLVGVIAAAAGALVWWHRGQARR